LLVDVALDALVEVYQPTKVYPLVALAVSVVVLPYATGLVDTLAVPPVVPDDALEIVPLDEVVYIA
jgi:hypothetical protein